MNRWRDPTIDPVAEEESTKISDVPKNERWYMLGSILLVFVLTILTARGFFL